MNQTYIFLLYYFLCETLSPLCLCGNYIVLRQSLQSEGLGCLKELTFYLLI